MSARSLSWLQVSALAVLAASMPYDQGAQAQQVGTTAAVNPAAQARRQRRHPHDRDRPVDRASRAHPDDLGGFRAVAVPRQDVDDHRPEQRSGDQTNMSTIPAPTPAGWPRLTKGVMRFVGGQVSHAGNAQITTPNAVIGIRGGVGIFRPGDVYIAYGEGQVRTGSNIVTLGAGEYTRTAAGLPPTSPTEPPPNFVSQIVGSLQSQGRQGGGAPATATRVNQARAIATGSAAGSIATAAASAAEQSANPSGAGAERCGRVLGQQCDSDHERPDHRHRDRAVAAADACPDTHPDSDSDTHADTNTRSRRRRPHRRPLPLRHPLRRRRDS